MKVKELERTVNVAWSPAHYHPILLAAGTAAQQLDASFSTSASLDLYSLNFSEPGLDLELKCSVPSPNRFHKVVWGGSGAGIIVGGCDSGRIQMYSVGKMLNSEEALLPLQDRHTGPVRSLDFNPFQLNLLASGAAESDIFIWDLNNLSTPMAPGSKTQPFEDVFSISWNRQVQHILASTFHTRCIVWDLRKNEPIIKLTDSNSRVRWKEVAWHPEVATQLCLASEDDSNPVVQLWDLRFATSPLRSLQQHTRGILTLAWCSQDSDLLISSGKDNRILCWNPNADHATGELQCEIPNTQQLIYEVAWCPRNPNLIASCSADSHASVYCLTGSQNQQQTSTKIADSFPGMDTLTVGQPTHVQQQTIELTKPPKWMRRPVGASFAFGGKLVSFGSGNEISISSVASEMNLVTRARQVQETISSGQAQLLCQDRQDPLWKYLEATFSSHPPQAIRNLLGYPQAVKETKDLDSITKQLEELGQNDMYGSNNIMDNQIINGSDPFDSIAAKQNSRSSTPSAPLHKFKIPVTSDSDGAIVKNLLLGDIEAAVDLCLKEKRTADALVLAMAAGPDVLASTQQKYFNSVAENNVECVIRAVVTNDWSSFVEGCDLISWKEALVAVLTYTEKHELADACQRLGHRLVEHGGDYAEGAEICYIASGSIASLIEKRISESSTASIQCMQDLVELVMVGQAACQCHGNQIPMEGAVSDLLTDFALILASQGDYQAALSYLNDAQGERAEDLRSSLYANLGVKQPGYPSQPEQQMHFQQQKVEQPNRRFSSQSSSGNLMAGGGPPQFNKMSPAAAAKSNMGMPADYLGMAGSMRGPQPVSAVQAPPPPAGVAQQPPPPSPSPGLGMGGNKKYLVDPSVGGGPGGGIPQGMGMNRSGFGPAAPAGSGGQYSLGPGPGNQGNYPQAVTLQPSSPMAQNQQGGMFQPPQQPSNILNPVGGGQTQLPQEHKQMNPNFPSAQSYHSGASGWNDPPVLTSSSRSQKRVDPNIPKASPITHPLFGSAPEPYNPGMPPNVPGMQHMQSRMAPGQMPPPPPTGHSSMPGNHPNFQGPPQMGMGPPPMGAGALSASSQMGPPGPAAIGNAPNQSSIGGPPSGSIGPPPGMSAVGHPQRGMGGPQMGPSVPSQMQMPGPPQMGTVGPPQMGTAGPPQMGTAGPPQMGTAGPQMHMPGPPQMGAPPQMAGRPQAVTGPPQMGGMPTVMGRPPQMGQMNASPAPVPPVAGQIPSASQGFPPPPLTPQQCMTGGSKVPDSSSFMPPMSGMSNPAIGNSNLPPIQPAMPGVPPIQLTPRSTPPSGRMTPQPQVNGGGYGDPPTPRHVSGQQKPPLPDSYRPLQDALEMLRSTCHNTTSNMQVKRKLEDVARKLELMYDALRESKLSNDTLTGLEQIVKLIAAGDYTGALGLHTRMISGPDFSQISSFMPALKVLIQTSMQLNVYLN